MAQVVSGPELDSDGGSYLVKAIKQTIASPTFSWTLPILHKDMWEKICFGCKELRAEFQWLGDAAFYSAMATVLARRYPDHGLTFHTVSLTLANLKSSTHVLRLT